MGALDFSLNPSDDILALLDRIAATPARTEKEALLAAALAHPVVCRVVSAALDPFVSYGIAAPPPARSRGTRGFDLGQGCDVADMLDAFATRDLVGNAARDELAAEMKTLTAASAELLRRILARDLRCGVTARTVEKVRPGTVRLFDVMLAEKFSPDRVSAWPVAVEPKLDGVRVAAVAEFDKPVAFLSRNGKPFTAVDHLGEAVRTMIERADAAMSGLLRVVWGRFFGGADTWGTPSLCLDGEVVSGGFAKTVGDVRRKDAPALDAEYHVFDAVPVDLFRAGGGFDMPYADRRGFLEWLVSFSPSPAIRLVPVARALDAAEVDTHYRAFRAQGLEGAIVKPFDGRWEKKRSFAWMKLKAEETADLTVTGAYEGEGKYAGSLGGLVVEGIVDGRRIATRVGGGFSDDQRRAFWKAWRKDADTVAANAELGSDWKRVGALVNRLVEVEYHEVTPDGALRHPRFVRFRDDKDTRTAA